VRTKVAATTLVGGRIRALRKRRDISTEKLAERASIDPAYLGGIERGTRNPTVNILARIAHALDVSLATLLDTHEGADEHVLRAEITGRVKGMKAEELRTLLRVLDAIR
jgi:transcriptional regulator with XRE-family HTH domain